MKYRFNKHPFTFALIVSICAAMFIGLSAITASADIPKNNCKLPIFSEPAQGSLKVSAADESKVRYLGRAMPVDGKAYIAFPLAGLEFNVTDADGVYLNLSTLLDKDAFAKIGYDLVAVFIDDSTDYVLYHLANSKFFEDRYIKIASFDTPGDHKIRLMTVTGPEVKTIISEVAVSGNNPSIAPSTPRTRKMEVVGSSSTVSLGIMTYQESQGRYDEAWQSYSGRAAEHFNADISIAAIGGGFLVDKDQIHNAHRFYYLADAYRPKVQFGGENDKYVWDFSRFDPDIVVVNLGSNLAWATVNQTVFVDFYRRIRAAYSNQDIVVLFALGGINTDAYDDQIVPQVKYINEELGDENVYCVCMGGYTTSESHPSFDDHQVMAQILISKIEEIMPEWKN